MTSVAIARLRGPREITAAIPWHSGVLWISGAVMLVDEVLYSVSAVSAARRSDTAASRPGAVSSPEA